MRENIVNHKNSNNEITQKEKLKIDTNELIGKQSVRTTFRLSTKMIELLKIAAKHLGIKQKSLIDQLMEGKKVLTMVAEEAQNLDIQEANDRRPKTFVLSRKALDLIDEISVQNEIPRDLLVELSIARLVPYVEAQRKIHAARENLLEELEKHHLQANKLLGKADEKLSHDDQFKDKLEKIFSSTEKNINEMRKLVKNQNEFVY